MRYIVICLPALFFVLTHTADNNRSKQITESASQTDLVGLEQQLKRQVNQHKIQIERTEVGAQLVYRACDVLKVLFDARITTFSSLNIFSWTSTAQLKAEHFRKTIHLLFCLDKHDIKELTPGHQKLDILERSLGRVINDAMVQFPENSVDEINAAVNHLKNTAWGQADDTLNPLIDLLHQYVALIKDSAVKNAGHKFDLENNHHIKKALDRLN